MHHPLFSMSKKSKNFCCQEHFAFLTLGYQWRGITICSSRRNCGDNTGILLRCRTFEFGSVPIRCGSFSFAVFLTAGDSVLNFVIIKTAPICGAKGDDHHAEYSSVTPPNSPRVARITFMRDFVPPTDKTAHKRLCAKIMKGA